MPSLPFESRVLFEDDDLVLAAWGNLMITMQRGAVRRDHLPVITRSYQSVSRAYPSGVVAVTLIRANVPISDSETRAEASKLLETLSASIRHISIVLEGTGIWAGTMRTVIRGLSVVARIPFVLKVHDDVASAARVIAPAMAAATDQTPTESDVVSIIERLRASRR